MKKRWTAVCLLLTILAAGLNSAGADGLICDLMISNVEAISAEAAWNCTYKDDQNYILEYHVAGRQRDEKRQTERTYYRLNSLCPSTDYVLTISTLGGGQSTIAFTTLPADTYTGYHYRLLDTGLYKSTAGKKDYANLISLDSKTLPGEVYDYDFSLMFQFSLTASGKDKSMHCMLVLHLPNGDLYTKDEMFWYTLKSATTAQYYPFSDLLEDVLRDYGQFPTGEYTLTAYFDGALAAETTFTMD